MGRPPTSNFGGPSPHSHQNLRPCVGGSWTGREILYLRRGDLIEIYKLMTNKKAIPFSRFFLLTNRSGLRGHRCKICRKSEGAIKQRFFSRRAIEDWNELGDETVSVGTIKAFKTKLGQIGY